jgi:hypothetical protein
LLCRAWQPKAKSLHTLQASPGVHLGIRPYTDNCHTNEFSAPIMEALAVANQARIYRFPQLRRPASPGALAAAAGIPLASPATANRQGKAFPTAMVEAEERRS